MHEQINCAWYIPWKDPILAGVYGHCPVRIDGFNTRFGPATQRLSWPDQDYPVTGYPVQFHTMISVVNWPSRIRRFHLRIIWSIDNNAILCSVTDPVSTVVLYIRIPMQHGLSPDPKYEISVTFKCENFLSLSF